MLTKVCAFCGFSWVLPSVFNSVPGSHLGHHIALHLSCPLRLLWSFLRLVLLLMRLSVLRRPSQVSGPHRYHLLDAFLTVRLALRFIGRMTTLIKCHCHFYNVSKVHTISGTRGCWWWPWLPGRRSVLDLSTGKLPLHPRLRAGEKEVTMRSPRPGVGSPASMRVEYNLTDLEFFCTDVSFLTKY